MKPSQTTMPHAQLRISFKVCQTLKPDLSRLFVEAWARLCFPIELMKIFLPGITQNQPITLEFWESSWFFVVNRYNSLNNKSTLN